MKRSKLFRPLHALVKAKRYNSQRKSDLLYNKWWERYRLVFLNTNPRCYACGEKATVVDHLIPHKADFKLFWKMDNYIPMCDGDHSTVTNMFDRHHAGDMANPKKLKWLKEQREMNELTFPVKVVPFGHELEQWIMDKQAEDFEDESGE